MSIATDRRKRRSFSPEQTGPIHDLAHTSGPRRHCRMLSGAITVVKEGPAVFTERDFGSPEAARTEHARPVPTAPTALAGLHSAAHSHA